MRKYLLLLLLMSSVSAFAFKPQGKFSFIPRLGLNLSSLSDMSIYMTDNTEIKPRKRADFMVGLESEYSAYAKGRIGLGVSLGVFYSRQGTHYPDYADIIPVEEGKPTKGDGWDAHNIKLDYINVPLTLNFYINQFISVRTGFQCGFSLGGKWNYDITPITVSKEGKKDYGETAHHSDDIKDKLRTVVMSIPLGVGFEYRNVLFDIRYNFPLSRFGKDRSVQMIDPITGETHSPTISKTGKNHVFTFSVGYRF